MSRNLMRCQPAKQAGPWSVLGGAQGPTIGPPGAPGTAPAPTSMDPNDLERVERSARLARLELNEVRRAQLAGELRHILDAFAALARVDVSGVEPMTRPEVPTPGPRADEPERGEAREVILGGGPRTRDGFFVVPKTVDRSDGEAGEE